jgi:hypothetical protein
MRQKLALADSLTGFFRVISGTVLNQPGDFL